MDERAVLVVLALVLAPWGLAIVVAVLRGYGISLTMRRRNGKSDDDHP